MSAPADNRGDGGGRDEQGELFERQLYVTYPNPDTQAGVALADIRKFIRLRQSDWLHVGWRLAAAIKELKYLGWPIISTPVHVVGRKRPIAEYSLPQWVLSLLDGTQVAK